MAMQRMTSHQFRTTLAKLRLTQVQAAHVLGITPRTARRYALGEVRVPNPAAKLLRLMLNHTVDISVVRSTKP